MKNKKITHKYLKDLTTKNNQNSNKAINKEIKHQNMENEKYNIAEKLLKFDII